MNFTASWWRKLVPSFRQVFMTSKLTYKNLLNVTSVWNCFQVLTYDPWHWRPLTHPKLRMYNSSTIQYVVGVATGIEGGQPMNCGSVVGKSKTFSLFRNIANSVLQKLIKTFLTFKMRPKDAIHSWIRKFYTSTCFVRLHSQLPSLSNSFHKIFNNVK